MEKNANLRVVIADRIDGGVYIEFADGKCAIYLSSLLYDMLPQASQVVVQEWDES